MGHASAPARTSRASAAATATTGTACTCTIRATWCRNRTCRPIPWLAQSQVDAGDVERRCARCARSACRTPTTRSRGARPRSQGKTELDALIAYLQGLGTALKQLEVMTMNLDIRARRDHARAVRCCSSASCCWAYSARRKQRIRARRRGCRSKTDDGHDRHETQRHERSAGTSDHRLVARQRRRLRCGCCGGPRARSGEAAPEAKTTGHVWDEDLSEYNNPLPRWWMWLFYITIVFGFVYLVLYPGLGSFAGMLRLDAADGSTQRAGRGGRARSTSRSTRSYAASRSPTLAARSARRWRSGSSCSLNNCAQCHGSDARGARGLPEPDRQGLALGRRRRRRSRQTITNGRSGVMPPLGAGARRAGRRGRRRTTC